FELTNKLGNLWDQCHLREVTSMASRQSICPGREELMSIRLVAAIAAICLSTSGVFAQNAAKPTDPQIAHIAYTAGQIDIEASQQALNKSQNKDVREFATAMERDHKAVNEKALALVKKLNVTPEDND